MSKFYNSTRNIYIYVFMENKDEMHTLLQHNRYNHETFMLAMSYVQVHV